jgi:hypothetical protein
MTPIVNATITPITIAFDAISLDRINNTIMEIAAVAEISAAGAISHGTSCANQASVFMVTPFHVYLKKNSAPITFNNSFCQVNTYTICCVFLRNKTQYIGIIR